MTEIDIDKCDLQHATAIQLVLSQLCVIMKLANVLAEVILVEDNVTNVLMAIIIIPIVHVSVTIITIFLKFGKEQELLMVLSSFLVCKCDTSGTLPEVCNKGTGQCLCKEGYDGERCDRCKPGYHGYPNCRSCNCSDVGSSSFICDANGRCPCLANFAGRTCDQCRPGYYRFPECLRKYDKWDFSHCMVIFMPPCLIFLSFF